MIEYRLLIYTLLTFSLLVDTINGILINDMGVSISPIYKALIMLLCLVKIKNKKLLFSMFVLSVTYFTYHLSISYDFQYVFKSIDWIIKFFYIVVIFVFLRSDFKEYGVFGGIRIAEVSLLILGANFFLGSLGYGYSQYGSGSNSVGTRGFFYAGNEVSLALACAAGVLMLHSYNEYKIKVFVLVSVFAVTASALTTMKTSMLSILVIFVALPLIVKRNNKGGVGKVVIFCFTPIIVIIVANYFISHGQFLDRILYFYDKHGLTTLIFSHRNVFAEDALSLVSDYSFLSILLGTGYSWIDNTFFKNMAEIDPVDVFMTFGLLGVIIVYGFFLKLLQLSLRVNVCYKGGWFLLLLIIVISFTSGHVVFSGIAGHLIALVAAITTLSNGASAEKRNVI